jgi:hypothetical protein
MWVFLMISFLVVSLTLNHKIQFFDDATAQPVTPGLQSNLSSNRSGTFNITSNITSSNQGLSLAEKALSDFAQPSHQDQASYIAPNKTSVQANSSGSVKSSCDEGDGLVIGGYSLNTSSDGGRSMSNVVISANMPVISNVTTQSEQQRSAQIQSAQTQSVMLEGWITGVINNGDRPLELLVNTLCLNLKK